MKYVLRRLVTPPLMLLAALFMFFEEWLWERLKAAMERFGRLPLVRNVETRIAALPPKPALAVFLMPSLLVLPVKLGAVWLIVHGHPISGLAVILAAKVVGMALFSRIFVLCRPALLTLSWFRRLDEIVLDVLARLHAWADAWPPWQKARALARFLRERLGKNGFFARRWQAILARMRKDRRN